MGRAELALSRLRCLVTETRVSPDDGGARRDRTDDLLLAKQALSQLSYGPMRFPGLATRSAGDECSALAALPRQAWWAWEDLNFRPHAYQARALTN
jgi:hypothetical protein